MPDLSTDPGAARIVGRDGQRTDSYTVLLDMCPCGIAAAECDCPRLTATYRVEFAEILRTRRVPPLVATVATEGDLALRVHRYLRPFFNHPDIQVALSTVTRTGEVFTHHVRAGRLTVTRVPARAGTTRWPARPGRNRLLPRRTPVIEHQASPTTTATT